MVTLADTTWPHAADSVPLFAGDYHLSVEVVPGCFIDTLFSISEPSALQALAEVQQPPCHGDPGSVDVEITGGTPPLSLSFPQTNPDAMQPGVWTYILTDSEGCMLVDSIEVVEPEPLVSSVSFAYAGISDSVQVMLDVAGGTPPYNIAWTGSLDSTGWTMAPIDLGWFVEDANGCLDLGAIAISSNPLASVGIPDGVQGWTCQRSGASIAIRGPEGRGAVLSVFDLSGRSLIQGLRFSGAFDGVLSCAGPAVILVQDDAGAVNRWVK